MREELYEATGVRNIVDGLLNDPKKLDQDDDIIIDELPPDYEILKQVENSNFKYSNTEAYIGYSSRGCTRKCKYCAVNKLEPNFISYIDIKKIIEGIDKSSGPKQNLLLLDNNVLASPEFDQIIDDIKAAGFVKGSKFGPTRRKRTVDFNQGLDARNLTRNKMSRIAEIPLEPMRIGFDTIKHKEAYIKAVRLAHSFGQKNMSNYILYNFADTPEVLYERLKINIELNEEFNHNSGVKTCIYSFPMRFIPINLKNRSEANTGNPYWNKRYLRGMQVILNVMKGPVMPGSEFFYQAFGDNAEEFKAILAMPYDFIRNRLVQDWRKRSSKKQRQMPYVNKWMDNYNNLESKEKEELISILSSNDIDKIGGASNNTSNKKIKKLLKNHIEQETIVGKYKK